MASADFTNAHAEQRTAEASTSEKSRGPQPPSAPVQISDDQVDDSTSEEEPTHVQFSLFELIKAACHSSAVRRVKRGAVSPNDVDPSNQWSYLHYAAYYGSERVAAALIKAGANVHAVNLHGETPLHLACKWPHEKVVEVLLKGGANPNALNKRGRTPAHTAAHFCRRGALELIINAGGDMGLQDLDGNTPLHLAGRNSTVGPNDIVKLLLRCKSNVEVVNKEGARPMDPVNNLQSLVVFAAMESQPELMSYIIKRGGVKLDVFDASGMTPLQTAAFKGDLATATALLAGGAKVNFQASASWTPCPSLTATGEAPLHPPSSTANVKPLGDRSPLHFAAERGAVNMMELLIKNGAKVNNTANEGLISPLHIAVWNQQVEAVRVLLAHKADVKARVSKNGMAPLHFACNAPAAKLEIISMLLDAKADIEERCSDGLTPLMLAAQMAPADAVRLLLVRGARVQAKGRRGMTAVDCAEGRADILLVLAQHCQAHNLVQMATKATNLAQRALKQASKHGVPLLPSTLDASGASSSVAGPSTSAAPGGDAASSGNAAIDQLRRQLSATSAQLYAWAAAANDKVGRPAAGAAAAGSSSSTAGVAAAGSSSAAAVGTGAGSQQDSLQQLLGNMTLPANLSDINSSPLNNNRDALLNMPYLTNPQGNPQAPAAGPLPAGAVPTRDALSEAVQMLSCITQLVSTQSEAALKQNKQATSKGKKKGKATTTSAASTSAASSASSTTGTAATGAISNATPTTSTEATSAAATSAPATAAAGTSSPATKARKHLKSNSAAAASNGAAHMAGGASSSKHMPVAAVCTCHVCGTGPGAGGLSSAPANQKSPLMDGIALEGCVFGGTGELEPTDHHLHINCTKGCLFGFHLACWKVVRDQLKHLRPDIPINFSRHDKSMQCIGKDCTGAITQIHMEGLLGSRVVYPAVVTPATPPPATTAVPLSPPPPLVPRATSLSINSALGTPIAATTNGTTLTLTLTTGGGYGNYSWVGDKPLPPNPPPVPQVLLPPLEATPVPAGATGAQAAGNGTGITLAVNTGGGAGMASGSGGVGVPGSPATGIGGQDGTSPGQPEPHQVRRKRRPARGSMGEPAPNALLHASGEVLQGRNPPPELVGAASLLAAGVGENGSHVATPMGPLVATDCSTALALATNPALSLLRAGRTAPPAADLTATANNLTAALAQVAGLPVASPRPALTAGSPSAPYAPGGPAANAASPAAPAAPSAAAAPWAQLEADVMRIHAKHKTNKAGSSRGAATPSGGVSVDPAALPTTIDLTQEDIGGCGASTGSGSGGEETPILSPAAASAATGAADTAAVSSSGSTSSTAASQRAVAATRPAPAKAPPSGSNGSASAKATSTVSTTEAMANGNHSQTTSSKSRKKGGKKGGGDTSCVVNAGSTSTSTSTGAHSNSSKTAAEANGNHAPAGGKGAGAAGGSKGKAGTAATAAPSTPAAAPAAVQPLDIVHEAVLSLAASGGGGASQPQHLLIQCPAEVVSGSGDVGAWVERHAGALGALDKWRPLDKYGAVAVTLNRPATASQVLAGLAAQAGSGVSVAPLSEFPDDTVIAAQAQKVAIAKSGGGGNSWMAAMVDCWRILQELPPVKQNSGA